MSSKGDFVSIKVEYYSGTGSVVSVTMNYQYRDLVVRCNTTCISTARMFGFKVMKALDKERRKE